MKQEKNFSIIHFRFALIIIFSFIIMALDSRLKALNSFRFYVESMLYPILVIADSPHAVGNLVSNQFKTHSELLKENEKLSTENFIQRADILKLKNLEEENQALRQLLNSPVNETAEKIFAEVIDVDPDPYLNRIIVNRGSSSKVYEGMPVITDKGLVGQVMSVNYSSSRVLLLTDPNCSVPVIDERSKVRAICTGAGSYTDIVINNVPRSSDVKAGDILLTSGIGGIYPKGYPVAIVESVGLAEGQPFAVIKAKPIVDTEKMTYVLMFWTNNIEKSSDEFMEKAKELTDAKIILNQQRVKKLIETLSVKKEPDNKGSKKKSAINE